jgi:hypothetical protein
MSYALSLSQKIGNTQRLEPFPSLDFGFSTSGYVNDGGFANQQSVGSSNFLIPSYSGPNPVFSRATAATFRGSNGLIQYAPENLLPNSESFDNLTWTKGNLNTTGTPSWINVETAPNGLNVADCIFANSTASGHYIRYTGLSGIQSNAVTFSVFLKKNGYDRAIISVLSVTSPFEQFRIDVNLLTGSYSSAASGGGVFITASVIDVGNSWFRCSVTGSIGTKTEPTPNVSILESSGASSFSGDPTKGIYIWGAQLERSSTARPYISTTALPVYGPRFEYDLSGNPLGLLMEEQSANVFQYSEQFNNASFWTPTNITVAADQITSPSGLLTADKLTTSGAAATQRIVYNTTQTGVSTYSIYVKAGTASFIQVVNGSSANVYANFNVSTGVAGNVGSSATSSITSVGNGWYRCVVSATIASSSSWQLYIVQSNTAAYGAAFSATVANLYVWGAQLEAKPFATSYMPTVGGTSTRNADVVNSTIGSWYNTDEGTIVVKGDRAGFNIQDSLFEFTSGTTASLAHRGDGTDENFLVEDATTNVTIVETIPLNSPLYFAASYSDPATQVNATVNAEPVQGTTLASTITTPTTLNIGYSPEISTYFNGHIKAFRYYAKALPSRLESFTLTA